MRFTASLLLVGATAVAHAARIEIGPMLQNAQPDGVTVVWESDAPVAGALLVEVDGRERRIESPVGVHHEARVTGLAPGRYRYRVSAGDAVSAPAELATATTGDHFAFLVTGDHRDGDAEHAHLVQSMLGEHADLVLETGDMTSDAGEEGLWKRFFAIEAPLLAQAPFYPTLGNHELLHDPLAVRYHRFFALPGPAPEEERYYSFRYANALFIALDGNRSHDAGQAEFLRRTLAEATTDPRVRHTFVFFHQPPFSVGDFCGSAAEQGEWVPEFERFRVRAVFSGHDHSYQRLERSGVRYFVTGGGGAPLHREAGHCPAYDVHASRVHRPVHHFLRVRVRGDEADLDALASDGSLLDSVRLHEPAPASPTSPPPIPFGVGPSRAVHGQPRWPVAVGIALLLLILLALVRRRA
jgi:acid phosphatase type 7